MKQIFEEYGDVIVDAVAVALLVGILTFCFMYDQGIFPTHFIMALEPIL